MTGVQLSSSPQPDSFWLAQIVKLVTRDIPEVDANNPSLDPQKVFHRAMEALFDYVHSNAPEHLGRRITNPETRTAIIKNLWKNYSNSEKHKGKLLRSEFLTRLGNYDKDNNLNCFDKIIKKQLVDIPNGKQFIEDPDFISATRHIAAAIFRPEEISQENFLMRYLPVSQKDLFSKGFSKIEDALNEAKEKSWFAPGTLNAIIKEVTEDQKAVLQDHHKEKVERGFLLPFIVHHCAELIKSGGDDSETFKHAILVKLKEFSAALSSQKTQQIAANL